jgi:hypothetical protein
MPLRNDIGQSANERLAACLRMPQRTLHRAFDWLYGQYRHAEQVELEFPTLGFAVRYAERQGLHYVVQRLASKTAARTTQTRRALKLVATRRDGQTIY